MKSLCLFSVRAIKSPPWLHTTGPCLFFFHEPTPVFSTCILGVLVISVNGPLSFVSYLPYLHSQNLLPVLQATLPSFVHPPVSSLAFLCRGVINPPHALPLCDLVNLPLPRTITLVLFVQSGVVSKPKSTIFLVVGQQATLVVEIW